MNSVLNEFNNRLMPAMALDSADERWASTIRQSFIGRIIDGVQSTASSKTFKLASIGIFLQRFGFVLVALILAIIAAPQFANDKEGLALLIGAAMGIRLVGALLSGTERYVPTAIDAIVLLFFAVNVVASFGSHYLPESMHGLAKLAVYVIAYYLFAYVLQTNTRQRSVALISALTLGALLVSLYGLWQYKNGVAPLATWEDPTVEDKVTRVFSTLGNPNFLAGYLIPIVPLSFILGLIAAFKLTGWKKWFALPVFGASAIITAATFLTGSRGGWLALIAESAVLLVVTFSWIWKEYPRLRLFLLFGIVILPVSAVLLLHFVAPSFEHRFLSIFQGSEHSSNAYRMHVWRASLNMFKDNWWIGIGTGNKTFVQAYGLYMRSGFDALGTYCVPLEIGVESGIPGLLAFGWMLAALSARAHCRFWGSRDITVRLLAVGGITAIVGMMAHGLFDTVFYRPQVQFVFWLTVAMIVALPTPAKDSQSNANSSA